MSKSTFEIVDRPQKNTAGAALKETAVSGKALHFPGRTQNSVAGSFAQTMRLAGLQLHTQDDGNGGCHAWCEPKSPRP